MLRCAVLDDYQGVALKCADWAPVDGEVEIETVRACIPAEERRARLAPFDIIVAMRERTPFDADLLDNLPTLKLLVTTGMKNAAIDMEAARRVGILVCGTSSFTHPTPEHCWALLLALCRKIPAEDQGIRNGSWQRTLGTDLAGQTLGLIGFGKVARVVARYGLAFEMDVLAHSPSLTDETCATYGVRRAGSLNDVLTGANVVSLHVPLKEATRSLIGADELAAMKSGALLVNTSRGPVVDTAALVEALHAGRLGGAAVDVFEPEPVQADELLLSAPNTVLTPHLGYVTRANYARYYGDAVEDIRAWLDGAPKRVLAAQ